jgi:hypothetical protein
MLVHKAELLGYMPPANLAWAPIEMRHLLARNRADGQGGGPWPVDTLFPATLKGRIDTSSVDEGTAAALYGLVRLLSPRLVLETGTHKGRSTRAIATALRDSAEWAVVPESYSITLVPGHLYTVDLADYGLATSGALPPGTESYVTQIVGETPGVLATPPLDTVTGFDFAFLDGDHTAEGLEAELTYLEHHRAPECWVAVDNSRDPGWPGVASVLRRSKHPHVSFASCTGLDILWMRD